MPLMIKLDRQWHQAAVIACWIAALLLLWEVFAWLLHNVIQVSQPDSKLPYLHKMITSLQRQSSHSHQARLHHIWQCDDWFSDRCHFRVRASHFHEPLQNG